jgi:uncharacterized tellurite resistance protein B-like protein
MIQRLKNIFEQREEVPAHDDIQLAAAALMIEVMRSDNQIEEQEVNRVSLLLARQFNLDESDISELVDLATGKLDQSISLHKFTSNIKDSWGNEERVQLLQHLWSIAYSDGDVDTHERHIIRKIGALLYMTERQMYAAKERARIEMSA